MRVKKNDVFEGRSPEEWLKEAEKIEAEIANVELAENEVDKERLRSKILMEIYRQEEEDRTRRKPSATKRIMRFAACFVAAMVGIFGLSMTSQANRTFIVGKVQEIFSDDADVRIKNEEATVASGVDEKAARDDIETTLEISVPEFYYMPDGVEFSAYEMFEEVGIAEIRYIFQEKVIVYHVSGNDDNAVSNRSVDGKSVDTLELRKEDITIDILELTNEVNGEKAYSAQWLYKNTYNCLEGCMSLEEIENILKNMKY